MESAPLLPAVGAVFSWYALAANNYMGYKPRQVPHDQVTVFPYPNPASVAIHHPASHQRRITISTRKLCIFLVYVRPFAVIPAALRNLYSLVANGHIGTLTPEDWLPYPRRPNGFCVCGK